MRRATPFLLAACAIGLMVIGFKKTDACRTGVAIAGDREVAVKAAHQRRSDAASALPAATYGRSSDVAARTLALTGAAAELLAEEVALRTMPNAANLQLTGEQWTELARVTANCQAVRQAFEASIATPHVLGRGLYRVDVPAYPHAGDALRAKLHSDLRAALGDAVARHVTSELGDGLEAHFAGFGVSVQTLDFKADLNGAEAEYEVTRTIKYWKSKAADDRLTTRQETHFPGLEDAAGHTWGPFLALLAERLRG
jgi:hypothetical protein